MSFFNMSSQELKFRVKDKLENTQELMKDVADKDVLLFPDRVAAARRSANEALAALLELENRCHGNRPPQQG